MAFPPVFHRQFSTEILKKQSRISLSRLSTISTAPTTVTTEQTYILFFIGEARHLLCRPSAEDVNKYLS